MSVDQLLRQAKAHSIDSFALTDINTTSACMDFMRMASSYGIRPVIGVDFRDGISQCFVALAKDREGF